MDSKRERQRDVVVVVGIICVKIDDDLALEACTQKRERQRDPRSVREVIWYG